MCVDLKEDTVTPLHLAFTLLMNQKAEGCQDQTIGSRSQPGGVKRVKFKSKLVGLQTLGITSDMWAGNDSQEIEVLQGSSHPGIGGGGLTPQERSEMICSTDFCFCFCFFIFILNALNLPALSSGEICLFPCFIQEELFREPQSHQKLKENRQICLSRANWLWFS